MRRREFLAGAVLLPALARPAFAAGAQVEAGDFGPGVAGINRAIERVAAGGGGIVRVTEDTGLSGPIRAADGVALDVPRGVTVRLERRAPAMVDWGEDVRDFALGGGGTLDVGGNATYCLRGRASVRPRLGPVRFVNWKRGPQFESGPGGPPEGVTVRDVTLGRPFVHPRDPERRSEVGHGLRITCRPSLGHAMIPWVDIDGLRIAVGVPGSYRAGNAHTADQVTLQGVIGGSIRNVVTRHGGEVGLSLAFGCRDLDLEHVVSSCNDGNGIYVAGAHYRLDLAGRAGALLPGETVTGEATGATGEVEYVAGDVVWLMRPSREKIRTGERIRGVRSGATATVAAAHTARDIRIHESCRAGGNGLDAGGAGREHQGIYVQHAESVGVGGVHSGNHPNGLKVGSSSWYRLGRLELSDNPVPLVELGGSVFLGAREGDGAAWVGAGGAGGAVPSCPTPR